MVLGSFKCKTHWRLHGKEARDFFTRAANFSYNSKKSLRKIFKRQSVKKMNMSWDNVVVGVVGLGYVGLPLAVRMSKFFKTIGADVNQQKINSLVHGIDYTGDVGDAILHDAIESGNIQFTNRAELLKGANFIIAAVPTPVSKAKVPDLSPILSAAKTIGENLQKGTTVVLESTVFPGVTQEIFGPAISKYSSLQMGVDFFLGYSPERVNPGDKEHTIDKIVKVVSGQDEKTLSLVAEVYSKIISAGIHRASCIKVAEAAKVIENTQRDLNIALVNEFARIFRLEGIDVADVLAAAATKWNFLNFTPGLVGGHCLPEDPYYLTHRAREKGYNPSIILAGRYVNDTIAEDIEKIILQGLNTRGKAASASKLLIMGLTFKENVNDCRHSGAKDVIDRLREWNVILDGYDPQLTEETILKEFRVQPLDLNKPCHKYDGIVLISPHKEILKFNLKTLASQCADKPVLFDLKRSYSAIDAQNAGFLYLHL